MSMISRRLPLLGGYTIIIIGLLLADSCVDCVVLLQSYFVFIKLPKDYTEIQEYKFLAIVYIVTSLCVLVMHYLSLLEYDGIELSCSQSIGAVFLISRLLIYEQSQKKHLE